MKKYVNGKLTEVGEIVAPDGYMFTDGEVYTAVIPEDMQDIFKLCPADASTHLRID